MQAKLDKNVIMTEKNAHIVKLDSLNLGEHLFDFQLNTDYFSAIEPSELLGGEVEVHASLCVRENDFDLHLAVNGVVQVVCDRCLDAMDFQVRAQECDWDWDQQPKSIDLAWLAYELIVVNLPLVHSHQEGGCNSEMDALLQNHLCTTMEDEE